jgi:uncharacterized protein (DUF2062 family)
VINSESGPVPPTTATSQAPAPAINPRAPGAVVLALIGALIVSGIWFAFYMAVFLARSAP